MKIASKALTLRLEKVLSELISVDQCSYVKGRIMDYGLHKITQHPRTHCHHRFRESFRFFKLEFFYLRSWKSLILDSPSLTGYLFFIQTYRAA